MKHKDFVDLSVYAMILSLMRSLFLLSLVWLTSTYLSLFLKLNMTSTAEDSNEKHLSPWSEACEKDGIETTPLSPFLDQVSHQQRKNSKDVQGAGMLPANYENDH